MEKHCMWIKNGYCSLTGEESNCNCSNYISMPVTHEQRECPVCGRSFKGYDKGTCGNMGCVDTYNRVMS